MEKPIRSRFKHAWNAFVNNRDPTNNRIYSGASHSIRPDRPRLSRGNERSIVTSLINRIALDVSDVDIQHVRLDDNGRFKESMDSSLNECLTIEANLDQSAFDFKKDIVMSAIDEGCIAIVPVDTTDDPNETSSYDILTMRTGKIIEWHPQHVKISVYNEKTGRKEDVMMAKRDVAIIENPFYAVMNEPNSTLQRLIRKLNLLDAVDEQSSSGKLDMIIQLPYVIKSEARKKQAEERRQAIEDQLSGSRYGIAYTDGTERITQLNRPLENNLLKQIEYLTTMLFSQLGMTQSILDGTADEKTMTNYNHRVVGAFLTTIVGEMKRKFLTKTARSQKQSIMFFQDPFKLATPSDLAEMSDKFTRNRVLTSNEVRQKIGYKPSSDPEADKLINSNIKQPASVTPKVEPINSEEENQNGTDV